MPIVCDFDTVKRQHAMAPSNVPAKHQESVCDHQAEIIAGHTCQRHTPRVADLWRPTWVHSIGQTGHQTPVTCTPAQADHTLSASASHLAFSGSIVHTRDCHAGVMSLACHVSGYRS